MKSVVDVFISSVYTVTKVLSQIWGLLFCPPPPDGEYGVAFLRL